MQNEHDSLCHKHESQVFETAESWKLADGDEFNVEESEMKVNCDQCR